MTWSRELAGVFGVMSVARHFNCGATIGFSKELMGAGTLGGGTPGQITRAARRLAALAEDGEITANDALKEIEAVIVRLRACLRQSRVRRPRWETPGKTK